MSRLKNQKTFRYDSWKRILCRNCGRIIGESHLGERNTRKVKCKECNNIQVIAPPRKAILDNKNGYYWCEPCDSCFTAVAE